MIVPAKGVLISLMLTAEVQLGLCQPHVATSADSIVNVLGMEFVRIDPGAFEMGSAVGGWSEVPHLVRITKPFYMGRHEVTQAQWETVMGSNPSSFVGEDYPVEGVSWRDAMMFVEKLNELEGDANYRLPTEAEWEFVARAGTDYIYGVTDHPEELCGFANIADRSLSVDTARVTVDCDDGHRHTAPVGQYEENAWGVQDMTGNVWEWVADRYDPAYYARSPTEDPQGPLSGTKRVLRGGGWGLRPLLYRLSYRTGADSDYRSHAVGFRVALEVDQ